MANTTDVDFGLMGRKVSALADLAQHYVANDFLDSSDLDAVISQQFSWFNAENLQYVPWRRNTASWTDSIKAWDVSATEGYFGKQRTGIVISCGDANAKEAAQLISYLRNVHKSRLPIQLAYNGDADMTPRMRRFMASLGNDIFFIDLTAVFPEEIVNFHGWASKPFALLASRYPQTILLDADAVLFEDPSKIFSDYPALKQTGILAFHDRTINGGGNPQRQEWLAEQLVAAGRQPSVHLAKSSLFYRRYVSEEADSAMVAMDKSRPNTFLSLLFTCWMNERSVREKVTYKLWYGDKESYWLAPELAGIPYAFEPWYAARMAQSPAPDPWLSLTPDESVDGGEFDVDIEKHSSVDRRSPSITQQSAATPQAYSKQHGRRQEHSSGLAEDRYCTTHMVHMRPDRTEPMWANGGLLLDKGDHNRGLANWTHWFVGERADEAIRKYDQGSTDHFVYRSKRSPEDKVTPSQAIWLQGDWNRDARECPQHDPTRWKALSPDFKTRLNHMIQQARFVEKRWKSEFDG